MEQLDGLFSLCNGGGKIDEIVFGDVLDLVDKGWQCGLEFREGGILFCARRGGDEGAQVSHSLFQRGRHNDLRFAEIAGFRSTVLRVCPWEQPLRVSA
jgi:hypothetical protein